MSKFNQYLEQAKSKDKYSEFRSEVSNIINKVKSDYKDPDYWMKPIEREVDKLIRKYVSKGLEEADLMDISDDIIEKKLN